MQRGIAGLFLMIGILVLISAVVGVAFYLNKLEVQKITDFESCAKMGNPVMESYPAQCNSKDGRHFVQTLSEEEKKKLIPPESSDSGRICAQVITPAKNNQTGECKDLPTPCDVPEGWEKVGSCEDASNWKTYTNSVSRYQIQYPPKAEIKEEANSVYIFIEKPVEFSVGSGVYARIDEFDNPKNLNLEKFHEEYIHYPCGSEYGGKCERVTVNGRQRLKAADYANISESYAYYLEKDKKVFRLCWSGNVNRELGEQIFTTFKFLE